jgi:hypothetical protein
VAPATSLGAQCEPGCGRVRVTIRAVFGWWARAPAGDITRVVAARALPLAFEWSAGRCRSVVAGDDAFVDGWWALVAGVAVRGTRTVAGGTRTVVAGTRTVVGGVAAVLGGVAAVLGGAAAVLGDTVVGGGAVVGGPKVGGGQTAPGPSRTNATSSCWA